MALSTDTTLTNAYKATDLGDIKPTIVIGGTTEKFVPNTNISYKLESDKEQFYININRKSVTVDKETQSFADSKIQLTIGNETDIWHVDENGRLKWDIAFKEKPSTNVFEWEITYSSGLEFCYQPALTQAEIDKGTVRPDDVVGSYAVYCNKSGHVKDIDGNTKVNYRTGKLAHIYRPLCKDAKGNEIWATLDISGNKLTITIPQKYLDNAEYPVTLDPVFGYTSNGATIGSTSYGSVYWGLDATNPAGTLTNLSIYTCTFGGNDVDVQYGFYSDSSGSPSSRLAYDSSAWTIPAGSVYTWRTNPSAWSYTLVEGNQCWGSCHANSWNAPGAVFRYDSGGSRSNRYRSADTTPPASAGTTTQDYTSAHFSVYATYTEAGGASPIKLDRSNPIGIFRGMYKRIVKGN